VTTLPAKRNMIINPKGRISGRRTVDQTADTGNILVIPEGKGWIIGNKIISRLGFILGLVIGFDESGFSHFPVSEMNE
jgi:hypothetical protein